jgi:hypothetical protein
MAAIEVLMIERKRASFYRTAQKSLSKLPNLADPSCMDVINPLAGSLLQSTQMQRQQAAEKQRQTRRVQVLEKDVAAQDDQLEHQVESTDEKVEIHDEQTGERQPRKRKNPAHPAPEEPSPPHLDLTA